MSHDGQQALLEPLLSTGYAEHADAIVPEMLRLFRGDNRRVMRQTENGRYGVLHSGCITHQDLVRHLEQSITVARYLLDENGRCSTVCLDIDIPKAEIPGSASERAAKKRSEYLHAVRDTATHLYGTYGLSENAILVEDTGDRGYHVGLFFEEPQPGGDVVVFGDDIRLSVDLESLEVFPPTATHGPTGFSKSLVRLPPEIRPKRGTD